MHGRSAERTHPVLVLVDVRTLSTVAYCVIALSNAQWGFATCDRTVQCTVGICYV